MCFICDILDNVNKKLVEAGGILGLVKNITSSIGGLFGNIFNQVFGKNNGANDGNNNNDNDIAIDSLSGNSQYSLNNEKAGSNSSVDLLVNSMSKFNSNSSATYDLGTSVNMGGTTLLLAASSPSFA